MRISASFLATALLVAAALCITPGPVAASSEEIAAVQDPAPRPTPPAPPVEPIPPPPKRDEPPPPAPPVDAARGARMIARFDKDADGKLSAAELPEFLSGRIAELDKDGDGLLSAAEINAMPAPPRGEGPGMGPPDGMGGPGGMGRGERDGMARAVFADPVQLFARLDANQDGKVTKEEFPERLAERLAAADLDQDGALTVAELTKAGEKERADQAKRTMERLDVNKDGKITKDEIPERMGQRLQGLDTDQDGAITLAELSAPPPPRPDDVEAVRRDPAAMIARLDRNADGKLSGEEIPGWMQRRMAQLDKNADGALTADELGAMPPADKPLEPPPKKEGEKVVL